MLWHGGASGLPAIHRASRLCKQGQPDSRVSGGAGFGPRMWLCSRSAVGGRGTQFHAALRAQLCAGHHHKLNLACVQGDVLADLSQADLEEAYSQADINFTVSKWSLDELRLQVSCDSCQQDTQVSKQLPGSCSKAALLAKHL